MFALTPFYRHTVYDPFKDFEKLERRFFGDRAAQDFGFDLYEEDESFVIEADLPGFSKSDINIEIESSYLTIRAKREPTKPDGDERRYIHSERFFGSLERSFDITQIDTDRISAAYENGVLMLTMPKKKVESPKKKSLSIE